MCQLRVKREITRIRPSQIIPNNSLRYTSQTYNLIVVGLPGNTRILNMERKSRQSPLLISCGILQPDPWSREEKYHKLFQATDISIFV
jgi:hypothetical protein